jgi:hypothetical protein
MLAATSCLNCGIGGVLKKIDSNQSDNQRHVFKKLGHNPFSGHLHYQCPVCKMVMLVEPTRLRSSFPFFIGKLKPLAESVERVSPISKHETFMSPWSGASAMAPSCCR